MKILILGGYGTFGGRLAHLLAHEEKIHLLIAGRSLEKAKRFCDALPSGATKTPLFFDRLADTQLQLKTLNPDLVVDATGPFQLYEGDAYKVVKACLALSINYMDLADGSDFVKGISQFDAQAKEKRIYILSGVSSFPVLSAAVVRKLSRGVEKVTRIRAGIAPSPYAGVGLNVIRAITAYAGKPVNIIRNQKVFQAFGLTETMHYTIAPPGYIPLPKKLFSLVDVPDLKVLPDIWKDVDEIWIGAGPVPEILHRMLIGLSWLVRWGIIPSLVPFAPLFHFVINILRWGEHRGGMFVAIDGTQVGGQKVKRSWHLLAENESGPFIPSMAIEALVRKILINQHPTVGARAATNELEVEDYETVFKGRDIYLGERDEIDEVETLPLYQRMLSSAWRNVPNAVREMHTAEQASGVADIENGKNIFAKPVAFVFGFPKAGKQVPVHVDFIKQDKGELWKRNFAGKTFSSLQWQGENQFDKLLMEKFGLVTFTLAMIFEDGKIKLRTRHWMFLGLRLPLFLAPDVETCEYEQDGRFHFYVEIKHKLLGLIVRYQGWLKPQ